MTLTPDELKRLAEIVTGKFAKVNNGEVMYLKEEKEDQDDFIKFDCWQHFRPSLTGSDWQKAQALDVILAALQSLTKPKGMDNWGRFFYDPASLNICLFEFGDGRDEVVSDDILTAAARALLGANP